MSNDVDGLPTAAKWIEFEKVDPNFGEGADLMVVNGMDAELEHEDELVRRKDVAQLIQDKKRNLKKQKKSAENEAHAKGYALAHDVSLELRGSIETLEKLLDEVEGSESA